MGDLVPLADYARGARVHGAPTAAAFDTSLWFQPAPEGWDPCKSCPIRGACREVRECHWPEPSDSAA